VLLQFVEWCEASALGTAIRESPYAFAIIESVHLLALAVIGGAILVVDLRLLGIGLKKQPVAELARDAWRWQNLALGVLVFTGIGLFLSESLKCYYSTPFWVKMSTLMIAVLFAWTVRRMVIFAEPDRFGRPATIMVALISMTLWFVVGASGRWIGFSG
jgi:hypothetical protein